MADIALLKGIYRRAEADLHEHYRMAEPLLERVREAKKRLFDALRERGELWVLEVHYYRGDQDDAEEYLTREEAEGMARALEDSDDGKPVRLTGPGGFVRTYD
jgi:hypothetical protein